MKCNLQILQKNNISYSWTTLYVGVKYKVIDIIDVSSHATEYLNKHPTETDPIITELACLPISNLSIDQSLVKTLKILSQGIEPETDKWILEKRKIRLCLLINLNNTIKDVSILLEKIAGIYTDFDYPSDMEEFIYYMPAKNYDPSIYSLQQNQQRLLYLFNVFLNKEKNELQNIPNG